MPSALYTIAYKPTSSVVALCSLEKKPLSDAAAAEQLLTTLIGDKLPVLTAGSTAAIEIAASELGCDLVKDPSARELEAIVADPYRFRVSIDPNGTTPTTPGDGKEKFLIAAQVNTVSAIELFAGSPDGPTAQVVVTLTTNPDAGVTTRLLFDDRVPMLRQTSLEQDGRTVSTQIAFDLVDAAIDEGSEHGVMFLMEGTPVVARKVKADPSPSSEAPSVAPRAVLRKKPAKPEVKAPRKLRRTARKRRSRRTRRTSARKAARAPRGAIRAAKTAREATKADP
jgi:hypothetical protein